MNSLIILLKKEFVQMARDFKVIWLPIVFIFLGMTQPVITYYLPHILEALGGSQKITISPSMTDQKGGEVLASTLGSQFDQLGIIIIVISIMSIIQMDKANGMLSFILTRPVTSTSYIGAKIIANYLIVAFSIAIGFFASALYVYYLFITVPLWYQVIALLFYLIWVLFIVSFVMMISTIFYSQGVIALISIVFLIGCRIIVGLSPITDLINPASMSKQAMEILITESMNLHTTGNMLFTLVWIIVVLLVTSYWISHKKFNYKAIN